MTFAADTSVPVARSRGEIEDLIRRAGGKRFMSAFDDTRAYVRFEVTERQVQFELELPTLESFATEEYEYRRRGMVFPKTRTLPPPCS